MVGPSLELLGFPLWLLWVTCLAWLEIPFYSLQKRNQRVDFPLKFIDLSKANFSYRDPIKCETDNKFEVPISGMWYDYDTLPMHD